MGCATSTESGGWLLDPSTLLARLPLITWRCHVRIFHDSRKITILESSIRPALQTRKDVNTRIGNTSDQGTNFPKVQ
jgi:hypothetical protein